MLISSMNSRSDMNTEFIVWFYVYKFMIWTPVVTVLDPVAAVLDVLWGIVNYEYMYAN